MTLRYDPPDGRYTSAIPPGVTALRQGIAAYFGFARTEVVRDRSRCQQQRSEHCSARAIDFYSTDYAHGRQVFDWLVANADELGVQSVIWWRRV